MILLTTTSQIIVPSVEQEWTVSRMTIDEAIRHCEEVAEDNDLAAGTYDLLAENNHNLYEKLTAESNSKRCTEFAGFNRQLAEWLKELKEVRDENARLRYKLSGYANR